MKSKHRSLQKPSAFTVVELIAVVAVIAILIGLLVPALSTIQKMAANVSQKAQFSTIGFALEAFAEEMGDYPESEAVDSTDYQGAQRLAEAMIGLDGFGFHPGSLGDGDPTIYDPADPVSIAARKGPYLELDTANAVRISNLDASIYGGFSGIDSFILADKFKTIKNTGTGKKTGMPILYFKANTINTLHPVAVPTGPGTLAAYVDCIYSFLDNRLMLMQNSENTMDGTSAGTSIFYADTLNPNFTDPRRPYKNESYILLSAGADGLYGTKDDVYNFDNGK
jgi:type II secretory pathway pseudopilin PulG